MSESQKGKVLGVGGVFFRSNDPASLGDWYEKHLGFQVEAWGDTRGDVESRFSKDFLCTTMSLYWLTDSFVNSVRYYHEAANQQWKPAHERMPVIDVPTGISLFAHDMPPGPLDWTASYYKRTFFKVHDAGGHFAAKEEPRAVVEDIRETFRPLR